MVTRNVNINITGNASQVNSVFQSLSRNAKVVEAQLLALQNAQGKLASATFGQQIPVFSGNSVTTAGLQLQQLAKETAIVGDAFRTVTKTGVTLDGELIGLTSQTKTYTGSVRQLILALQQLDAQGARINAAGRFYNPTTGRFVSQQGITNALTAPADLPQVFTQLPRNVQNRLGSLGLNLSSGTALGAQNAYETFSVTRDAIRQVNRLSGSFTDHKGVLNRVALEYTDAGKIITRFGGNLSGLGNVLNQIGRDFQKVIEFAIATTVVFGALRKGIQELELINQVEKNIRQLSITANISRKEAFGLFNDIADIAISTATPIQELIKATDDIALATRRAGQSTGEWKEEILSLTNSVGILTNLAGIDTVRATDLLVSTMKQLNLQADQLPAILNKITAVAGGQSNAIADIIQGLGVMAEAASQANLTIDETIATVQTLAQVTAKSPSEIATAFKNLVGSIDSAGGKKALEEFNIALRDTATGELRNILDIYGEISDKIEEGVIPPDRVKGLVKAIAGGPRRAPDAAALLSNINDIQIVAERSISATNEALIANAKILDTTSAKLTQIQARVDKFAVTKFADIVREGASALADVLNLVLDVLDKLHPSVITAVLGWGTMLIAIKLLMTTGRLFIGTIAEITGRLAAMTGAIQAATVAQQQLNQTQAASGLVNRFGGPLAATAASTTRGRIAPFAGTFTRGLIGPAIAGAALGGLSAASGASPASALGAGLQGAGLAALLNPIPIPQVQVGLKVLGAAALAAGTLLQVFVGSAKDEQRARESNTESLLNAISQYNQANRDVANLSTRQGELSSAIQKQLNATEQTSTSMAFLRDKQQEYAQVTVDLINSTGIANEAFNELSKLLGANQFKVNLARSGQFDEKQLKDLAVDLTAQILERANPGFINPEDFVLPPIRTAPYAIPATGETIVTGEPRTVRDRSGMTFPPIRIDLRNLDAGSLSKLFDDNLISRVQITAENLDLIAAALDNAAINETIATDKLKLYNAEFNELVANTNALAAAQRVVATYSAYLTSQAALGIISPEEAENGQRLLDVYLKLIEAGKNLPSQRFERSEGETRQLVGEGDLTQSEFQEFINKQFFDKDDKLKNLSRQAALDIFEEFAKAQGELQNLERTGTLEQAAAQFFINSGIVVKGLTDIEVAAQQSLEELIELQAGLEEIANDALTNFAQKSADLRAQLQGGAISSEEYAAQYDQLLRVAEGVQAVSESFGRIAESSSQGKEALDLFASGLTDIIGLQDAENLLIPDLVSRLFDLANTYNLTGEQVLQLVDKLLILETSLKRLAEIREIATRFNIDVNAAGLKGLADAIRLQAKADAAMQSSRLGEKVNPRSDLIRYADELDAIIAGIESASSGIGNIYKSGAGTKSGSTSRSGSRAGSAKGPDVSTIDLPKEIADSLNRDALIQEAIKRARTLQSQIPGASAEARDDIVELLKGTQRILEVRGVKDDLLRKALEELADIEKQRLEFETKADTIQRIRVGAGSFAAFANVPLNTQTGVSVGGPQGPITVNLNINGQLLTPAQFDQLADKIGAAIKNQIANG